MRRALLQGDLELQQVRQALDSKLANYLGTMRGGVSMAIRGNPDNPFRNMRG
jgi:hypothetical protein